MADSRLETSLHPVHDLALLPSACIAVIRLRTNVRQTRVIIISKAACAVGLPRIVKYTSSQSIWGVAVILYHVSLRLLANVLKIAANTAYIVTQAIKN